MTVYRLKDHTPKLGARVFVAPNATVVGDVEIGDDSSVWFGAIVRGDVFPIRVGARTNIQDNAVLHVTGGKARTIVGDDVTIGHHAIIHGCTVGSRCLIGMGAILLDDAHVEDEAFVGAGTLVPPGMRIPTGMLALGRPAKIVRHLTSAELAQINDASAHYVLNARDYTTELQTILPP